MQPTIQTSIPTISSVRRTADCLCAHDSVDVVMGSDFTRYCARLVIRIARSPSPVQRAAVSSYDFVVYVYDYTNRKHTQQKWVNATKDGHAPDGVSDSSPQNRTYDAVPLRNSSASPAYDNRTNPCPSSPNASPGTTAVLAVGGERYGGGPVPCFWLWQKSSVLCKNKPLKLSILCILCLECYIFQYICRR